MMVNDILFFFFFFFKKKLHEFLEILPAAGDCFRLPLACNPYIFQGYFLLSIDNKALFNNHGAYPSSLAFSPGGSKIVKL